MCLICGDFFVLSATLVAVLVFAFLLFAFLLFAFLLFAFLLFAFCFLLLGGIREFVAVLLALPLCGAAPTFLCRCKEK
ncbi:membrane hypothetical protein [Paraburkholderia sabiae]|nr:membrane hypothetical protein [Paraburkholderia sabiae]